MSKEVKISRTYRWNRDAYSEMKQAFMKEELYGKAEILEEGSENGQVYFIGKRNGSEKIYKYVNIGL